MANGFGAGEADAAGALAQSVETMGARYGIRETQVASQGRGAHVPLREPYLLPPHTKYATGNMETVTPSIQLTPLGAEMPGPAMPPPQIAGHVGAFPLDEDNGGFKSGVLDGFPEGPPVPVRSS